VKGIFSVKVNLVCLIAITAIGVCAQNQPDIPRLSGIVNLREGKAAVFEFATNCCGGPRQLVLSDGHELWGVNVLKISPEQKTVEIKVDGVETPVTLKLAISSNSSQASPGTINLVDASLHSCLELYGEYSGKTLLYWPNIPPTNFSLSTSATNDSELTAIFQKALAEKQIQTVPDGDKFLVIVPQSKLSAVKPNAPKPKPIDATKAGSELLRAGSIWLHGASIEQIFDVYADLVGANYDRSPPRFEAADPNIFLYTRSPLSKEECVYAFDTLFRWRGFEMVRTNGLVRPVQLPDSTSR
jgi:hypothetical protein